MATAGMADNFAFNSIFLCCKGECGKSCHLDLSWVGCGGRVRSIAEPEGDIHEAERLVCRVSGRVRMLARSEQEEETKCGKVCSGQGQGVIAECGYKVDMVDKRERDRFDACRRRVDAFVAFELLLDAVFDFAAGVEAAVLGPHAGHRLTDGT